MEDNTLKGLRLTYKEAKEAKELAQKCYYLLTDLHSELFKAGVIKINHDEPERQTGSVS